MSDLFLKWSWSKFYKTDKNDQQPSFRLIKAGRANPWSLTNRHRPETFARQQGLKAWLPTMSCDSAIFPIPRVTSGWLRNRERKPLSFCVGCKLKSIYNVTQCFWAHEPFILHVILKLPCISRVLVLSLQQDLCENRDSALVGTSHFHWAFPLELTLMSHPASLHFFLAIQHLVIWQLVTAHLLCGRIVLGPGQTAVNNRVTKKSPFQFRKVRKMVGFCCCGCLLLLFCFVLRRRTVVIVL